VSFFKKLKRGMMMKIYATPFAKEVLSRDLMPAAFAQSGDDFTFIFGSCDGGPDVVVTNGQFQGCFDGDPTGESIYFQCSETGSAEYIFNIDSAVAGGSCGDDDSGFIVTGHVSGDVPSNCTVTRAIGPNHCDDCSNTPESLGNGNCNDGIDNDCDGGFDQGDFNCAG